MSNYQDNSSNGKSNRGVRFKDDEKDIEMSHEIHVQGESDHLEKHQWQHKMSSQISSKYKQVKKEFKRMATISQGPKQLERTKTTAKRALKGLEFVNKKVGGDGWAEIEKQFDHLSADGLLLRSRFGKCIGINEQEFAGELFDALARRKGIVTGTITKDQLREFWDQLSNPSFDARMQTFFDMVDKNADGKLTEDEVREIILVSASANQLWKVKENADEFAALIMKALDPDGIGYIEMKNLETLFLQAPKDADGDKLNKFLGDQKLVLTKPNAIQRAVEETTYFFEVHWKKIWVMLLWLSICVALFTWKFIQYKNRYVYHVMGNCVATAKGAAETLKFNMALILLPVCRKTITWIRSRTKLGGAVPFDDNINFHQVLAVAIGLGVATHVISHLTCDFPRLLHASTEAYAPLAKYFGIVRPPNYGWFLKGTEGWTGITMVVLMAISFTLAQPWFRKNKVKLPKVLKRLTGFNAFWYSHHLFVVVYALLFVHGICLYLTKEWYKKTTWMYISVPILLYACERLIKSLKSSYEKVEIKKFAVYRENEASGNALSLQMTKPSDFEYSSGQYIFVKCMDVSPFEWHPFSLTSAPGDDYISVHIRALGDWTKQLISLFSKLEEDAANVSLIGAENGHQLQSQRKPRLKIDGPYGAPAQDYKNYDVLLLVGLGIGATPLISIIKDVLYRIKQRTDIESGIEEHGAGEDNSSSSHNRRKSFAVKRVYFNWVTREQGSFDWFKSIMNDVAEIDQDHVIEMHNYCSCVHKEGDARSAMFTMLQSLQDAKNGLDIVSGTRVKTHFGRANWDAVFNSVRARHPNQRVGVFYCGTPALIKKLRQLSQDFSRNTSTKFDFHKENF